LMQEPMAKLLEEPEAMVSAHNIQFKCPECDRVEQVIYVGGPRSGLIQCVGCGKVLWHGRSSAAKFS
jgi:ribosomal protein S27E